LCIISESLRSALKDSHAQVKVSVFTSHLK
jgi:hypothetical protein